MHKRISKKSARNLYTALLKLVEDRVVVMESQERYLKKDFDIALNHDITVYDPSYIAQARKVRSLRLYNEYVLLTSNNVYHSHLT